MEFMYIGQAAKLSGATIKSIRHYEEIGLLPPPQREGKYRVYRQESVDVLRFIKCAQQLGFKLKELQDILQGYNGLDFPWDLAQHEIARKKNELLTQIDAMQQLYEGLADFEQNLNGAKEECHLAQNSDQTKKNHPELQS
jgi:DNA-binding transcriptional MerR regulator|tara:strand:- start:255 stop:674 length:420 start_codon:yes stop_codon:yes gene_type:complete